ncbi:MAG: hypothetical protein HY075_13720 [Deltaproteobacteria bacterium]|nr:hypothetical protein [Deltaproteobacteria bacterium]
MNYDATVTLAGAPAGDYYVKITNVGALGSSQFPGGSPTEVDATRFYLAIATVNDATAFLPSNAAPLLAKNVRCESTDAFPSVPNSPPPAGSSTGGGSSSSGSPTGEGGVGTVKGCGTIRDVNGGDHDDLNASAVFTAWGITLLLVFARVAQQLARRYVAR